MKRRITLLAALLAALALTGAVLADGEGEALISLSYLQNIFRPRVDAEIDTALDRADDAAYSAAEAEWRAALAAAEANVGSQRADTFTEAHLKRGDLLTGPTGLNVLVLAGDVTVQFSSGAVVDVTNGTETASGTHLTANHRYLVAEDTTARFTAAGKTAVVSYCGPFVLSPSGTTDYPAMASALKALGLFRGSDTAFAQGFDLEKAPTRMEALIMLLRLLGEEDAALACTAAHPFTDVPDWCAPYVAYAWEKGYSNGIGKDRYGKDLFGTQYEASATQYTEFILRALGYSSTDNTDITDAPERALAAGVLTAGECELLRSTDFLRADIAYLSYYALSARTSGGTELSRALINAGVFTSADYRAAKAMVTTDRLA